MINKAVGTNGLANCQSPSAKQNKKEEKKIIVNNSNSNQDGDDDDDNDDDDDRGIEQRRHDIVFLDNKQG